VHSDEILVDDMIQIRSDMHRLKWNATIFREIKLNFGIFFIQKCSSRRKKAKNKQYLSEIVELVSIIYFSF